MAFKSEKNGQKYLPTRVKYLSKHSKHITSANVLHAKLLVTWCTVFQAFSTIYQQETQFLWNQKNRHILCSVDQREKGIYIFFKETCLKNYLVFCCCIVSHIGFPVMEIVDKAWKVTAHVTTSSVEIGKICWVRFVVCCSVWRRFLVLVSFFQPFNDSELLSEVVNVTQ